MMASAYLREMENMLEHARVVGDGPLSDSSPLPKIHFEELETARRYRALARALFGADLTVTWARDHGGGYYVQPVIRKDGKTWAEFLLEAEGDLEQVPLTFEPHEHPVLHTGPDHDRSMDGRQPAGGA